jgi:hypothetical protein
MAGTVESTSVLLKGKHEAIKGLAAARNDSNLVSYEDLMGHIKTIYPGFDPANATQTLKDLGLDAYLPKVKVAQFTAMSQSAWTAVGATDWDDFFKRMDGIGGFGGFKDSVTQYNWNKTVNDTLLALESGGLMDSGSPEAKLYKRLLSSVVASPNPISWENATHLAKTQGMYSREFDAPIGGGFEVLFFKNDKGKYRLKSTTTMDKRTKDIYQDYMRLLSNVRGVIPDPFSVEGMNLVNVFLEKAASQGVQPYNPKRFQPGETPTGSTAKTPSPTVAKDIQKIGETLVSEPTAKGVEVVGKALEDTRKKLFGG